MAKISGILTDGAGQIINDCTIELYAKKTTSKVLTQTQAFQVASNGNYTMNVLPCEYDVSLIINGFPKKRLGTIQVYSDSLDGTLNDFLLNPSESEITPLILQQVVDARNEAKQAATKAETSETNAAQSAKKAKTSETNAANSATSASQSEINANNSERSASTSATSAKNSADNASNSAKSASQYATNAGDSAKLAKESENNSKTSETNAAQSAKDAQKWASTVDNSNFIQKSGEENQSIDGSLDVKKLTENGVRVYSPNNKPKPSDIGALAVIIGDHRLMPFRANELPFGWYFRNGDNYLLSSPQGQVLNSLSTNYKKDHRITIKTISGQQYINVPNAFHVDGRGLFERPVNGVTRQVGHIENDTIRNFSGQFLAFSAADGKLFKVTRAWGSNAAGAAAGEGQGMALIDFDLRQATQAGSETVSINEGKTPAIFLGV